MLPTYNFENHQNKQSALNCPNLDQLKNHITHVWRVVSCTTTIFLKSIGQLEVGQFIQNVHSFIQDRIILIIPIKISIKIYQWGAVVCLQELGHNLYDTWVSFEQNLDNVVVTCRHIKPLPNVTSDAGYIQQSPMVFKPWCTVGAGACFLIAIEISFAPMKIPSHLRVRVVQSSRTVLLSKMKITMIACESTSNSYD